MSGSDRCATSTGNDHRLRQMPGIRPVQNLRGPGDHGRLAVGRGKIVARLIAQVVAEEGRVVPVLFSEEERAVRRLGAQSGRQIDFGPESIPGALVQHRHVRLDELLRGAEVERRVLEPVGVRAEEAEHERGLAVEIADTVGVGDR